MTNRPIQATHSASPTNTGDRRRTWISTVAPIPPRLGIRTDLDTPTILDGAWWPRSRDTVVELVNLIIAMDERHLTLSRIILDPDPWDTRPHRISVAERVIRVGWFDSLEPDLLIATTRSGHRIDLLVIAPERPAVSAQAAMDMATSGDALLSAAMILASGVPASSASTPAPRPSVAAPAALDR